MDEIRRIVAELQRQRKEAQPTNKRTFGSVFKNPAHELTAGRLLEACGLRGFRIGGAQISPKHANFIENAGGATTADVLELIGEARRQALEHYGVVLEPEVQLIGSIEIPALSPGSPAGQLARRRARCGAWCEASAPASPRRRLGRHRIVAWRR